MNKILLIISREYLTRVKKRSFILLTFLVPVLIAAMYGVIGYILINQDELSNAKKVSVVDDSGVFQNKFKNTKSLIFYYSDKKLPEAKSAFKTSGYDFILHIPTFNDDNPQGIELISDKQANINTVSGMSEKIEEILRTRKMLQAGIDTSKLNHIKSDITIETRLLTESGEKSSNRYAAYGVGSLFAFLIYLFIFLYGSQVMRGVIEEKTSRVIEVIVSSVKPFELMMGKIIGIALVGVTQFLLWVILSVVVSQAISRIFNMPAQAPTSRIETVQTNIQPSNTTHIQAPGATIAMQNAQKNAGPLATFMKAIQTVNFVFMLACFLFYFITGYLLYGALFAAVGSAVDSETETQQFMLPITLPLVFAFVISINYVVNFPDAPLSVWLSIIPFFAPIAMMVRLPFNPPVWQVTLSMLLMILGFIGTVWLAARIYRVGILMYGKKASFKEMRKWLFFRE